MSSISRVLSSKYIRSELFRHVSLIHRQLGITNVFHSSDIASLYHCVLCGDTAKFIHHCDQLDITIHSPQELLHTINNAFYHALYRKNNRLVTYIIERFRRGSNTTDTQFIDYVRKSLFDFLNFIDYNHHIKFSRPMIDTLLCYLPDVAPRTIVRQMMKSTLIEHSDFDLCAKLAPLDKSIPESYAIDHFIEIGNKMKEFNPMFLQHQSRIIDDLRRHIESHQPEEYTILMYYLVEFTIKHRLYDLLVMIAKHAVHYKNSQQQIGLTLSPLEYPISLGYLMELRIDKVPLFNRLALDGDISFMKHVQHLMPEYLDWIYSGYPYQQLYDNQLLQCALSGGLYDCALYILDNISPTRSSPFANNDVDRFGQPKWNVSSINMSNDPNHNHNLLDLVDTLIKHQSVDLDFLDLQLYMDAIKARRLDVIEYLEQLISDPNTLIVIDFSQALNVALQEQYIDAIKTIIHNRPGHVYEASTIRMFIKYEHHPCCWPTLLRSAELLNDMELIDTLGTHGYGHGYISDPWTLVDQTVSGIQHYGVDPIPDQMVYILHNERHRTRIDALLATPKHLARTGATMGRLIGSDVLAFFNLMPRQPFDMFGFTYRADVSRLDIDHIEFIWSRLSIAIKRDQQYINNVLSSNAAINNITMYRYVLDSLIKDNHFQVPFIHAPTIKQIKDNIRQYQRYLSIRLIVELFNPINFNVHDHDDTQSTTSPYHRLLVPLTSAEFQQYQSLLTNLGILRP
ncbi:hypothetical protein SAMD00019534_093010 [Acytostelium subglobosum LB1]|uniref:hypothetical protein n=1 Tax=Acytostelium subglobosum LB1 TaxID=1410327 RepID=UPI0006449429|nr:hypothetical protein SAMD00019534_093010 [Acytostelium subglobosum LB1]GAM26126.1 hypothetical protein SAMD00019534_093010 [Acytostelium subglobosum LB1]|eukprot:XP_012751169.1 hypothetical protein SAMD00019534_093010 [Acytostelium subglobosum LB1]